MEDEIEDKREDDIAEQRERIRHKETTGLLKQVATAITSMPKEDPELKKLMAENRDAINNFVKAVKDINKQEKQEVKVETNQDKVVQALGDLSKIMQGIGDRLIALEEKEEKPLPVKLKAERNRFSGEIDYVTIEYKKQ